MMKNTSPQQLVFYLLILVVLTSKKVYSSQNTTIPVSVGVVLDVKNTHHGKMWWNSINMALDDFYRSHPNYTTRIVLHTRDFQSDDALGAAAAALSLIKNEEVKAILGPDSSMQSDVVINLGDKARVPVITFSATSPSLSSRRSPYFFRAALSDSSQVQAISSVIKAFGWKEVVPIYADNEYGAGIIPYLTDALQMIDARVPYRSAIPPSANDSLIKEVLGKLKKMQTRVFVVHLREDLGARVFEVAKRIGMMSDGYVWIVTNGVAEALKLIPSSVIVESMQGVLGVKAYVPKSKQLEDFKLRWQRNFPDHNHPSIYTLWAYDATFALAMAIEKVNPKIFTYLKNTSASNTLLTDLETLGTSQTGHELQEKLSATRFRGLAGKFSLVDRQLQPSVFQLINLRGRNGENIVGFWSPRNGLSKKSNLSSKSAYTISKDDLFNISWPGEPVLVPRGWDIIPINGTKLKIGVPTTVGFNEFVNATKFHSTDPSDFTGYSIKVFKAVMKAMPYNVPYNFSRADTSTVTYDGLICKLYHQEYDAVVGDVTILPNRSKYADFALPYTESSISLVVPVKGDKPKGLFFFMQPWSGSLWLATFFSFVLIGFVTWVLEHRINDDFRGPPGFQATTIFWLSFSTVGFGHKENVLSGWGRFVVAMWLFIVLILTQSYTASLTTMLTVQQLKPTFTDVHELIKTGDYVGYLNVRGYLNGSFVGDVLIKLGFDKSKIRMYRSLEECHQLFLKGSANGGIAGAFDQTPYTNFFLERHGCSEYTMVGPVYKTAGLGFAFPRGSPLVPDVSRAIMNVTESGELIELQNAFFDATKTCQDLNAFASSDRLGLDSYWGLFVIAAACSFSALLAYVVTLIIDHRRALAKPDSKPTTILQHFHSKDEGSHIFRRREKTQNAVADNVLPRIDGTKNNTDHQDSAENNDTPPQSSSSSSRGSFSSASTEGALLQTASLGASRVQSLRLSIRSRGEERQGEITVVSDEDYR